MNCLIAVGLLVVLATGCSSGGDPVPDNRSTSPITGSAIGPTTEPTTTVAQPTTSQRSLGIVARLVNRLEEGGLTCDEVYMAGPDLLALGAREEAEAICADESLDIAVFPTTKQAGQYGREGGYPHVVGDKWVIITETEELAEEIADILHGRVG